MKQFILEVPDKKVQFFNELIHNLGFVKTHEIGEDKEFEIPEEHKNISQGPDYLRQIPNYWNGMRR
jgi:hypothetical protein